MVGDVVLGIVIALLVTTPVTIGIPLVRHWLWLRRFRQENRIAKVKWEAQCRAEDAAWETETTEWIKQWEGELAHGKP